MNVTWDGIRFDLPLVAKLDRCINSRVRQAAARIGFESDPIFFDGIYTPEIVYGSAMALTLDRAQPTESSSGLRKTAREKSVPTAIVMMTKAAPSTTHP